MPRHSPASNGRAGRAPDHFVIEVPPGSSDSRRPATSRIKTGSFSSITCHVILDHLPRDFVADDIVTMQNLVSERDDPAVLADPIRDFGRVTTEPRHRLADDRELPLNSRTKLDIDLVILARLAAREGEDQVRGIADVLQQFLLFGRHRWSHAIR